MIIVTVHTYIYLAVTSHEQVTSDAVAFLLRCEHEPGGAEPRADGRAQAGLRDVRPGPGRQHQHQGAGLHHAGHGHESHRGGDPRPAQRGDTGPAAGTAGLCRVDRMCDAVRH